MLNIERKKDELTKYERARIIGSRALQISQGAPILVKLSKKDLEELKYNPVAIAKREFEEGVVPIGIRRTLPHEKK
jgi:DNA-directed RNA polymerase subunit K/omega